MTVAAKVISRVEKLLRLGADREAADNEREVAAVEAARLIKEHGLRVVSAPVARTPPRAVARQGHTRESRTRVSPSEARDTYGFHSSVAMAAGTCDYCNKPYDRGEAVFTNQATGQVVHVTWPCDED